MASSTRTRKKTAEKTTAARSTTVIRRHLYGTEPEEEMIEGEIHVFATQPAESTVGLTLTKKISEDNEYFKVEVRQSVPCYKEDLDAQTDLVADNVAGIIDEEMEKFLNGDEGDDDADPEDDDDVDPEDDDDVDPEDDDDVDPEDDDDDGLEEDDGDVDEDEDEKPRRGQGSNPRSNRRGAAKKNRRGRRASR